MDINQAVITGTLQGLTEFLPISSSGHLVLTSSIYKILTNQPLASGGNEEVFFDIMLHVGTLIAILIYFRTDLIKLYNTFVNSIREGCFSETEEAKVPIYIMIGTISTIVLAFPLKDFFEQLVHTPSSVGLILIFTGTLLLATEYMSTKFKNKDTKIGWKRAIVIGLAQGMAVAPGLSRSGSTIAAGLATGLDRITCARYSFLLSIPIIILVTIYQSLKLIQSGEFHTFNWEAITIGTLISAVVGYYCIKYFIIFISKHKLYVFAIYCWIIGLAMFLYFSNII